MTKEELETIVALIKYDQRETPSSLPNEQLGKIIAANEGLRRAADIVVRFANGQTHNEVIKRALEEHGG